MISGIARAFFIFPEKIFAGPGEEKNVRWTAGKRCAIIYA